MSSTEPYRFIVDCVRDVALYFVDPEGIIVTWNPGAEKLHRLTAAEITGQHHAHVFTEEDRSADAPGNQLRTAERDGAVSEARWLVRKDGTRFWAETSCCAVRDSEGRLAGFAMMTQDTSNRRQLEQSLERTNEELNRFAFVVSHDLQEPVRTMNSYGELLARKYHGRLDADADEFIKFISQAATRMTQLLKDLLSYSQAGRSDRTRLEATSAEAILQWAIMNINPLIKETNAVITSDPLPSIHADQAQVAQLFQHLLTNSIKFRGEAPPQVQVSATRQDETLHRFSVRDNGIGIDKEFHERVFGAFKRLHGKEVPGTGIGLAICRKIVEAHGGRIWIESEAGSGAVVHFTLPTSD